MEEEQEGAKRSLTGTKNLSLRMEEEQEAIISALTLTMRSFSKVRLGVAISVRKLFSGVLKGQSYHGFTSLSRLL